MTEFSMNFIEAIRPCGDQDLLRFLAQTTLTRLMDFEVAQQIVADRRERNGERATYRNGYRERTLDTRLGTLELDIPKLRSGSSSRRSWSRAGCPSGRWRR